MLRSMTTYARVESVGDGWSLTLELKSVNGRFCDVHIKAPKWMNPFEDRIRKLVRERLVRGRIDLNILHDGGELAMSVFEPDLELGRSYLNAVKILANSLGLDGTPDLQMLLYSLKDVITVRDLERDTEEAWEKIEGPLQELLNRAVSISNREGAALERDIGSRLSQVGEWIEDISRRTTENLETAQQALGDRIQSILKDIPVDRERLAHEAAMLADRLDITEEIVRGRSHIEQFGEYLAGEGAVGRKLDFMLQEIFREVNTIASKSSVSSISHIVVEIKGELEKMREQVQNVV